MIDYAENLRMVQLYCINQGDKFRTMSEEVLTLVKSDSSEAEKVAEVHRLCEQYTEKFWYHVAQLRTAIEYDIDAD
jgi:predicted metal-dependent enzyme (double-stranded beta helix superfamily)